MASRRIPSGVWISALTLGALAVVGALAVQAQGALPKGGLEASSPKPTAKPSPKTTPKQGNPIPADSGTGRRIVYSVEGRRVWLVSEADTALRTFAAWPGTITPALGAHKVTFRREQGVGSDGVQVENVVYFGKVWAFSSASDGAPPSPNPDLQTGAIRERIDDGAAMWKFAEVGTTVNVVK